MAYATRTDPFVIQRLKNGSWVTAVVRGQRMLLSDASEQQGVAWFKTMTKACRAPHRLVHTTGMGTGRMRILATHGEMPAAREAGAGCPLAICIGGPRAVELLNNIRQTVA